MAKKPADDQSNLTYGAVVGATVTIVVVTMLILWAEVDPAVKAWLQATFSHHWVGKGILGIIVFFASGFIATAGQPKTEDQEVRAVQTLFMTSVIGLVILTLFFFYHAFLRQ